MPLVSIVCAVRAVFHEREASVLALEPSSNLIFEIVDCHFRFIMSVFSLDASHGNPITQETVDKLCSKLGVSIEEKEKKDYARLLAVFHDASEQLMAMEGMTSFT